LLLQQDFQFSEGRFKLGESGLDAGDQFLFFTDKIIGGVCSPLFFDGLTRFG
jgi:hypothetical protein